MIFNFTDFCVFQQSIHVVYAVIIHRSPIASSHGEKLHWFGQHGKIFGLVESLLQSGSQ